MDKIPSLLTFFLPEDNLLAALTIVILAIAALYVSPLAKRTKVRILTVSIYVVREHGNLIAVLY